MLKISKRLSIRRFNANDRADLETLFRDPEVMRFTGFKVPQTDLEIDRLLEKYRATPPFGLGTWAVTTHDGDFVGWVMLKPEAPSVAELGFMLPQKSWGRGYATELGLGMIQFGFAVKKLAKITAGADSRNINSVRVLEKLKMVQKSGVGKKGGVYFEITQKIS